MITDDFLTNEAYGFPTRGDRRRISPRVLAVVHITGNPKNQGPSAAQNERDFANRRASQGPSAHYYINRDGSGVHAIDERRFAAWSNGDLEKPNLQNAGVAYLVGLRAAGKNANEGCYLEIELVGHSTVALQPTDAQMAVTADLIRTAAAALSLPVNRRTVLTHADINSVERPNCAFLAARREAQMSRLIDMAQPDTAGEDDEMLTFTLDPSKPHHGKVQIVGTDVQAIYLDTGELVGVKDGEEKEHIGFGRLAKPYGTGSGAQANRQDGWLLTGPRPAWLLAYAGREVPVPSVPDAVAAENERKRAAMHAAVDEVYA